MEGTVTIREKSLEVLKDLVGQPDLHVTAGSQNLVKFLGKVTARCAEIDISREALDG